MPQYVVQEVDRESMADDEWFRFVTQEIYTPQQLQERTLDQMKRCFVFFAVRDSEQMVGAVALAHTQDAHVTELSYLITVQSHRRQGIGKLLFSTAIDTAKQHGYTTCIIGARESAMSFYDQFAVIHTGKFYTSNTGLHEWLEVKLSLQN